MARWRQTTSSRIVAGDSCWSSALVTASIVPAAISWPWPISSDSSRTTARGGVDGVGVALEREHVAAQEDVAVQVALERPQDRVLAARQLGGDGVVELELLSRQVPLAQRLSYPRRGALAVGAAADLAITAFITCAHVLGGWWRRSRRSRRRRSRRARRRRARRAGSRSISSASASSWSASSGRPPSRNCVGGLEPALALAAQHRKLVVVAVLGGLLQLGQHQAQRADALLLPGLHRAGHVGADLLGDRHYVQDSPGGEVRRQDSQAIPSACSSTHRTSTISPRLRRPPAGSSGCSRRCSPSTACRRPCRSAPARRRRACRRGGGASGPRSGRAARASGASSPPGATRSPSASATVPGRGEYENVCTRVIPAASTASSVRRKASSSSVGKPTITSVVRFTWGAASRSSRDLAQVLGGRCSGGPCPRSTRVVAGLHRDVQVGADLRLGRERREQRVLDVDHLDARQPDALDARAPGRPRPSARRARGRARGRGSRRR